LFVQVAQLAMDRGAGRQHSERGFELGHGLLSAMLAFCAILRSRPQRPIRQLPILSTLRRVCQGNRSMAAASADTVGSCPESGCLIAADGGSFAEMPESLHPCVPQMARRPRMVAHG